MSDLWVQDPLGVLLSCLLVAFGLLFATVIFSSLGAEFVVVDAPPPEASVWWWVTQGPLLYPSTFLAGAFSSMMFVFWVLMQP